MKTDYRGVRFCRRLLGVGCLLMLGIPGAAFSQTPRPFDPAGDSFPIGMHNHKKSAFSRACVRGVLLSGSGRAQAPSKALRGGA